MSSDDDHVTIEVSDIDVASEKRPVAVKACVVPRAREVDAGRTSMEESLAEVTVSPSVPVTPDLSARTSTVPSSTPVTRPAAFTVAFIESAEAHAQEVVRSRVLPSS